MRTFANGKVRRLLVFLASTSGILSTITGHAQDAKAVAQKIGVSSSELFLAAVPGAGNTEVTVLDVTHLPGASRTEGVRWLEFIVAEKGKGRSIRKP